MSQGVNSIHLIGNLGVDPELRQTAGGQSLCSFRMATNERNKTVWHRVVAWNQAAEFVAKFLKKGDLVYVEGWLEYREYSQGDQNRLSAEINARTVQALTPRDRGSTDNIEPPLDYAEEAPF